jgi:hypothetical protein
MENSFLYSKYISFLTGWTRSAGSLSLYAPLPGGPRRLHGPMCQPPVFSLSLSLSLAATWGPAISPSRLIPNLFPCASSVTATGANSGPRHAKDLRSGRIGPPHPSLAAELPLELVARRRHVMAACTAGRCDCQLCHAAAMAGTRCYAPIRA